MAVRLSALRAARPLPPRRYLVHISVKTLSRSQGHTAASSDLIGIRTRNLRLPHAPAVQQHWLYIVKYKMII
jgi:hypothetical protein